MAKTFRVSERKVREVRAYWEREGALLEKTGKGRGVARSASDRRHLFSPDEIEGIRAFIASEHEAGRQVFRHRLGSWILQKYGIVLSDRVVGGYLARLGYKRCRGRMKIPPMDEQRKARIRRFLVEMDAAQTLEREGKAVVVYMDESFVHQAHNAAYSYFCMDENGKLQDGFGRTSAKGSRMIMVHAITKDGPLVAHDDSGFPIKEGWFGAKKGNRRPGVDGLKLSDEPTAELLWQAKSSRGDYHDAMNDGMFMAWLKHRLTPAFRKRFGAQKMVLVLDNAPYHHGFDPEIKVPESNTKLYNTKLLQKYGVKFVSVPREVEDDRGNKTNIDVRIEVPPEGSVFPQARSKNGMSKREVARVTRDFFAHKHPSRLVERVQAFVDEKRWSLIWTPPYMPSFQPIELFWAHGKNYVSKQFHKDRKLHEVYHQIRQGWYGNKDWPGQEGGWKEANCEGCVRHAIEEMNAWIKEDTVLNGSIGSLVIPDNYERDHVIVGDHEIEGDVNTDVIMDEILAGETRHVGGVDEGRDGI